MYKRLPSFLLILLFVQSTHLYAQQAVTWTTHADITATASSTGIGTDIEKNTGATNTWTSGLSSLESLPNSEDGYVEATISATNIFLMFGLSVDDLNATQSDIEYAIYPSGDGKVYVVENGIQRGPSSQFYTIGDKIRVERKNGVIKYYYIEVATSNIVELYVSQANTLAPLFVDFSFRTPGATLDNVQVSNNFFNPATETHPNTGPTTDPNWLNPVGIEFRGNSIVKTLTTTGPNEAGASTLKTLNPTVAGWVQTRISQTFTTKAIGFSESPSAELQTGLKYGINISSDGKLYILENGNSVLSTEKYYQIDDIIKIERTVTGDIRYIHIRDDSGTIVVTDLYPNVTEQSTSSLHVSVNLYTAGATLNDIELSPEFTDPNIVVPNAQSDLWTDIVGLQFVDQEIIAKDGDSQWGTGGAASVASLKPGIDGSVKMTANETNTFRTLGLSESNINASNQNIDYGIQLTDFGTIQVIENGQLRTTNGGTRSYVAGDILEIKREGQTIKYYHDAFELYESSVLSQTRLVVDIALKNNGATLKNIEFSESFETPAGFSYWKKSANAVYYQNAVAIGRETAVEDFMLAVQGKIRTQGVKVTLAGWADFVFKNGYDLKSLAYVKEFIEKNGHLPDVPSEKEVLADGIELEKMDAILLRKIEELTLHMIKQNEKLIEQNKQLLDQTKKIEEMEKELKEIKKSK